jgi:NAD(P)-dependent dehydrogenase (short-subunit alcohol dehydrogenase family)
MARQPVSLITGGLGGLGRAVVAAMIEAGHSVIVLDVADGATVPEGVAYHKVDLTRSDEVHRAVEAIGPVDALFALAGGWAGGPPVWELQDEDFDRMLDLNLRTALYVVRAVLGGMVERNAGRIILVSARTAIAPEAGQAPYVIAKRGILALAETINKEVQPYDIAVNAVLPSVIDTPANRASMPDADHSDWVPVETLAAIMRWLATSPEATYIRGAAIPVYGRA